mgnify:CR=1 FL=1|jgi:hypothetical protein
MRGTALEAIALSQQQLEWTPEEDDNMRPDPDGFLAKEYLEVGRPPLPNAANLRTA